MIKKDLEKIDYPAVGECVYQTSLQNGLKLYLIPKADFNEAMQSFLLNSVLLTQDLQWMEWRE